MTTFTTERFDGHVQAKHGVNTPDGRAYWLLVGKVSILEGKEALGFEVKDDSNWFARIESADGSRSINLPGCQVAAIGQGDFSGESTSAHTFVL